MLELTAEELMAELEAEPQKTVQTAELEADELQTAVPLTELLTAELVLLTALPVDELVDVMVTEVMAAIVALT